MRFFLLLPLTTFYLLAFPCSAADGDGTEAAVEAPQAALMEDNLERLKKKALDAAPPFPSLTVIEGKYKESGTESRSDMLDKSTYKLKNASDELIAEIVADSSPKQHATTNKISHIKNIVEILSDIQISVQLSAKNADNSHGKYIDPSITDKQGFGVPKADGSRTNYITIHQSEEFIKLLEGIIKSWEHWLDKCNDITHETVDSLFGGEGSYQQKKRKASGNQAQMKAITQKVKKHRQQINEDLILRATAGKFNYTRAK